MERVVLIWCKKIVMLYYRTLESHQTYQWKMVMSQYCGPTNPLANTPFLWTTPVHQSKLVTIWFTKSLMQIPWRGWGHSLHSRWSYNKGHYPSVVFGLVESILCHILMPKSLRIHIWVTGPQCDQIPSSWKPPRHPNTSWEGIWTKKTYLKHLLFRHLDV